MRILATCLIRSFHVPALMDAPYEAFGMIAEVFLWLTNFNQTFSPTTFAHPTWVISGYKLFRY